MDILFGIVDDICYVHDFYFFNLSNAVILYTFSCSVSPVLSSVKPMLGFGGEAAVNVQEEVRVIIHFYQRNSTDINKMKV